MLLVLLFFVVAMLNGIQAAMLCLQDSPWPSECIFKLTNPTTSSLRTCGAMSKNNIAQRVYARIPTTGIHKLLVPFTLFPNQQHCNFATSASHSAKSLEYDSTVAGEDVSSQCLLLE